jgi:hypothetical protein
MRTLVVLLLVAGVIAGCNRTPPPPPAGAPSATNTAPQGETVKGRILERLDASPYTYFRLQVGSQELWAAVPENGKQVGQDVTLANPTEMTNFASKTLKRTFPTILFATLAGEAAAGASTANIAARHPGAGKGPDVGDEKTPKASGADARTVAEAFAQRESLKEKPVLIQGRVVKFNPGILGRNWIHLRDGSGSAAQGDNDITVTTEDAAAIGDVVTIRGTLRLDKDFGAGYRYPVIIEDAKLQK